MIREVATGQIIGRLSGHTDWVQATSFSPDGKTLASASWDGSLVVWDLDVEVWKTQACQIANRNLTREEWELYLGDRPYEETCPGDFLSASRAAR